MPNSDDFRDGGSFEYYVGGYTTLDGTHYNVEAGDPPLSEETMATVGVDYVSVYVDTIEQWIHIDGPFDDWFDLEYEILDALDEY